MRHELKTWPKYFEMVASGEKPFELRLDDRAFRVGDVLVLREWNGSSKLYTGRVAVRTVTCIVVGHPWLKRGYVCLGLAVAEEE